MQSPDPGTPEETEALRGAAGGGATTSLTVKPGALTALLGELVRAPEGAGWAEPVVPGERIGRFEIIREIGRGGFGVVYEAFDHELGRAVALKMLRASLGDGTREARTVAEAEAAARLSHPCIVQLHDLGWCPRGAFLVLELLRGEAMSERLANGWRPAVRDAVAIATEIARGVAFAHTQGVVHRDLKPGNVFLSADGQVKVLDFGLARVFVPDDFTRGGDASDRPGSLPPLRTDRDEPRITWPGAKIGTAAYMSPEQVRGGTVDERSDVWALGVILYELLTGARPFRVDHQRALDQAILEEEPPPVRERTPRVTPELARILSRTLQKDPRLRYQSAGELLLDLKEHLAALQADTRLVPSLGRLLRRRRVLLPLTVLLLTFVAASGWQLHRAARARWARDVAIPKVERLVARNDYWRNLIPPYRLAVEAERYLPDDRRLAQLLSACSLRTNVRTDPPGAKVYWRDYHEPDAAWEYLGKTPLLGVRVPIGLLSWKITKEEYDPVFAAATTWIYNYKPGPVVLPYEMERKLDRAGTVPAGMVRIPGGATEHGQIDDFFLDRLEVTNREFKRFVDAGGYGNRRFWKQRFAVDGREIPVEEALRGFRDQSGQPGPSTWKDGNYPEGKGEHPVTGISWYEAAAYAEFVGKSLPTADHWRAAEAGDKPFGFADYLYMSNFNGPGTVPVGSLPGMTPYGNLDMGGNAREWCWNETQVGRAVRGGSWGDSTYMGCVLSQLPATDRSATNGLRCAIYPSPPDVSAPPFQILRENDPPDFSKLEPVPDPVFDVFRAQFDYDPLPLGARVESRKDNPEGWVWETVTLNAPYPGERMAVHLFLPRAASPPYQIVIYFPGAGSLMANNSSDLEDYHEFRMFLSFIVQGGRAVVYPVYSGSFERAGPDFPLESSRRYSEWVVQVVKDFERTVEYLESRPDLDTLHLGYFGLSLGGHLGSIIPAVDRRIRASVLYGGGLYLPLLRSRPEVNPINYVTRVTSPTLMLNGKYDSIARESRAMFDLLGTRPEDKELKLYDTDHFIPRDALIRESQRWFDKYLGPVRHLGSTGVAGEGG